MFQGVLRGASRPRCSHVLESFFTTPSWAAGSPVGTGGCAGIEGAVGCCKMATRGALLERPKNTRSGPPWAILGSWSIPRGAAV
jgi:hypothetical protein